MAASAWIDRSDAGKLSVTGPDALAYLQAHLSADLRDVPVGGGAATALLTPRGQVRALARALRTERGWLLHCERPALEGLFRGLWSGRVGWRAALHKLTLQQGLVTVVGADPAAFGLPADAPEHAHAPTALGGVPVRAVRSWAGVDLLPRADRVAALLRALGDAGLVAPASAPEGPQAWAARRLAAARIAYGADATDAMLPAELALPAALVSTAKGLYPGLQTVLRQERSGTVHRRLCRVRAAGVPLAPGDELAVGTADGPLAGTVRTAADGVAFAVLRTRELEGPLVHRPSGAAAGAEPVERADPSL